MDSGDNYKSGRGGGGRGRGGGRGNYQEQGGRGGGRRGNYQEQGGRGGGGRGNYLEQGGRGGGGRGNYQEQGGRGYDQSQPNQGGGRGRGAPPQSGSYQPSPQQWVSRPPVQVNQPAPPNAWGNRPPQTSQCVSRPPVQVNQPAPPNAWGNRPPQTSQGVSRPPVQVNQPAPTNALSNRPPVTSAPPQLSVASSSSILPAQNPPPQTRSVSTTSADPIEPIPRPDRGGTLKIRTIGLLVNHFQVKFDKKRTIIHYDVDIKFVPANGGAPMKKALRKSETRFIKDQLFHDDQLFAGGLLKTAFDGEKNIFSAIPLPEGNFPVVISEGEDLRSGRYMVSIKAVNELPFSRLSDYLGGTLNSIPRDILQGMDLVMKENPLRKRTPLGKNFFSPRNGENLRGGLEALQGFQQSLKPTLQGLALCLDFSVLSFRKPLPVIEYLKEHVRGFRDANDVKRLRRDVEGALRGLLVKVNHRRTKQKYTIAGLTREDACDSYFDLVDPEGVQPPRNTSLLDYFREKWGKNVVYPKIPCLELGKGKKSNKVPMEFCILAEGQRFPKEDLDKDTALLLKNLTLAKPGDRMSAINGMIRAEDGPYGEIAKNFGIELDIDMTKVMGRVIGAPDLKIGNSRSVKVDQKCQWNLVGKSFIDSKSLDRWAIIDFTERDRSQLYADAFVDNLIGRCQKLGIRMGEPLVYRLTRMIEFSSMDRLDKLLRSVVEEANQKNKAKLQMIVCVMANRDPGYKSLKWLSETQIGVVTQCCLSFNANKGQDQYFANLCLKINAKLGGSNFELSGKLLHFDAQDHVMFIGADVNHPAPMNKECPSIAAVVGTVNWPAANRYAARVSPQAHRCEKINNFGALCLDLVKTYADLNKVRPKRIVVFRDGVSEGQFEMVLAQELLDMKKAIYTEGYEPLITIIVAQKRHQTRLFVEHRNDGGQSGNVPPGTVVDTKIVHPRDFDFYLCSHYGGIGTSKPTHYYVLWDENFFSSDQLQKLIYDMCFTFVRCTKPVSLVPPVYYADLVAYRGRMFQEVAMDNPQYASASFDQKFYTLHPDLENVMFFV